jgi:GWxTD domain-containing protein
MPGMNPKLLFPAAGLALLLAVSHLPAQTSKGKQVKAKDAPRETVAKPLSAKEQRKKEKALQKELLTPYKNWMDNDVVYIISDEEKKAFKQLTTDEEREQFVEQFWLRRDPTPDTVENEFKEEHYRRIAYANEHYASGIPGWRTDRGRIYIQYGPADEIESHPSGGTYVRPMSEGGGETHTSPFEQWRYRYIDAIGQNIIIEFVDPCMCGEYRMTMDPTEKDALLHVPNAGLTLYEEQGLSSKDDRFSRTDGTHLGVPDAYLNQSMNEFNRLEQFFKLQQPPDVKFKDLEQEITSRVTYNRLPMQVRWDYIRVTENSVLTNITIQFENRDLQFTQKDGFNHALIELVGKVTSMTRRPVTKFDFPLEVNAPLEMLEQTRNLRQIYQNSVALPPGRYHLTIIAKDVTSGNVADYEVPLNVPHFADDRLASSSLILADQITPLATRDIGGTMFAIGDMKVRPRVGDTFNLKTDPKMGVYIQFYNFAPEEKTNKPSGSIEYAISKVGSTQNLFDVTEDVLSIPYASANQVTVEKLLPLNTLGPGVYMLKVKATDKRANQTVQQEQKFIVN